VCGIFECAFVANLLVIKFWKSVNIWESYGQEFSVLFFLTHSVDLTGRKLQHMKVGVDIYYGNDHKGAKRSWFTEFLDDKVKKMFKHRAKICKINALIKQVFVYLLPTLWLQPCHLQRIAVHTTWAESQHWAQILHWLHKHTVLSECLFSSAGLRSRPSREICKGREILMASEPPEVLIRHCWINNSRHLINTSAVCIHFAVPAICCHHPCRQFRSAILKGCYSECSKG